MTIEYSNFLSPTKIHYAVPERNRKMLPHESAIRGKAHVLLNASGSAAVQMFMRRKSRAIMMQQTFENKDTVCALITADGVVKHYTQDGEVHEMSSIATMDPLVQDAWNRISPAETEERVGLVLSVAAFEEYSKSYVYDQQNKVTNEDPRFLKALATIASKKMAVDPV